MKLASAPSVLLRCWLANRLLDLGLIYAAKWLVPERRSFKGLLPALGSDIKGAIAPEEVKRLREGGVGELGTETK